MWFGGQCVWVLAVLCQVRSQSDAPDLETSDSPSFGPPEVHIEGPPPRPRFINGPTGFSVEEEHHRSAGVKDFVNGPTGTSVDATEDRPRGTFQSGPTGISLFTEKRRAQEEEEAALNNATVKSMEAQEDTTEAAPPVDDEPSAATVEEDRPVIEAGQEGDGGRTSNRGIVNTNPQETLEVMQTLPPGLHIDTADGSRDTDDWMYTGGEWARVNLPDAAHPGIPAPTIPGPALVVVTRDYLKKVTVTRELVRLRNVTLHYRFFLSQGEGLHGNPELKVYQVAGDKTISLASEKSRGDWSDHTITVPESDSFKIVFEARLMKEGNEIALDDITISGISGNNLGEQDNSSANNTPLLDVGNSTLINEDDNLTDKQTSILLDAATGNDTTQDEELAVSETVTPPTNTENVEVDVSEKTNTSIVDNEDTETHNTSSVEWVEETVQLHTEDELNDKKEIAKLDIQTKDGQESLNSTTEAEPLNDESISNDSDKLDEGENNTYTFSSTTDSNATAEENVTLVMSPATETTLTVENNQTHDTLELTNITSRPNNNESINDDMSSSQRPSQQTELNNVTPSVNFTDSPDTANSTLIPSQPQKTAGEGPVSPSTNSLDNTTINNSGGIQDSADTSTTSPSGAIITTISTTAINTTGTDSPVVMADESAATSWRVFQVFLVLCVLGLLGLGFLYWRKKRRQDDEIPVFTRHPHTDYHNPTFNMDDDASFVSRGTRHNYKSFE